MEHVFDIKTDEVLAGEAQGPVRTHERDLISRQARLPEGELIYPETRGSERN